MPERNKWVLMIGCGVQEVDAIIHAQDAGFNVIVTDRDDKSPGRELADLFWNFDGQNKERIAQEVHKYKDWTGGEFQAIFTLTELFTTTSYVLEKTGLPGASYASALNCHRKSQTYAHWVEVGIPCADFEVMDNFERLPSFVYRKGDLFIKPDVGFGSHGCSRVSSADQLISAYKKAKAAQGETSKVLACEYLEGTVHDVQGVFSPRGRFHRISISDRSFNGVKEIGSVCPSRLSEEQHGELYDLTVEAAHALGIMKGPVKADVMLTKDGFKFLEMAPRLHGPR